MVRYHEKSRHLLQLSIIIGIVQISHQEVGGEVWKFMIQRCIMESDLPVNKVEFSILFVQVCVFQISRHQPCS